jgi:hypothetical protein
MRKTIFSVFKDECKKLSVEELAKLFKEEPKAKKKAAELKLIMKNGVIPISSRKKDKRELKNKMKLKINEIKEKSLISRVSSSPNEENLNEFFANDLLSKAFIVLKDSISQSLK